MTENTELLRMTKLFAFFIPLGVSASLMIALIRHHVGSISVVLILLHASRKGLPAS